MGFITMLFRKLIGKDIKPTYVAVRFELLIIALHVGNQRNPRNP